MTKLDKFLIFLSIIILIFTNYYFLEIPIIIYFLIRLILFFVHKREVTIVTKYSNKISKINSKKEELNFAEIKKNHYIAEREYSRKSLDRVRMEDILFYHLDNNTNDLRTNLENSLQNKEKLETLKNYIDNLEEETYEDALKKSGFKKEKFLKIEGDIIDSIKNNQTLYEVNVYIRVYYNNPSNGVNEEKTKFLTYEELTQNYHNWQKGKEYAANAKLERKIMNDEIRYNVLKRDNYTCQICGAKASDGVKLHVDHIIPITRGGKTVMSNLQTLCERCNVGKSNKIDKDFENDMLCPKCGAKLVKRKSKYGSFIGCSAYPKCHYTREIKKEK